MTNLISSVTRGINYNLRLSCEENTFPPMSEKCSLSPQVCPAEQTTHQETGDKKRLCRVNTELEWDSGDQERGP